MKTFGNVATHTLQRVLKTFGNVATHTLQRVLKTFGNVAAHTECVAKCLFFVDVRSGVRREPTPHEA